MKTNIEQVTRELVQINEELSQIYDNFEDSKSIDLAPIQKKFSKLTAAVQESGLEPSQESIRAINAVKSSMTKINDAMSHYKQILESQLREVSNSKTAFKSYISNMHVEP